jgi:DNA-binding NarL/FixJ family response regulator
MLDNNKINLAIVDDHPIVIQGLVTLLGNEPNIHVAGTFTDGNSLLSFLNDGTKVHLVLLDYNLPDTNGANLCKEIKSKFPQVAIIALSNYNDRSFILQMLQSGASGYLLKNISATDLIKSVHGVMAGNMAFSQDVTDSINRPVAETTVPQLTRREIEVLSMIAAGKTSAMIAGELFVSPLTIETHRRNLMQKFRASNAAALIKAATEFGLL